MLTVYRKSHAEPVARKPQRARLTKRTQCALAGPRKELGCEPPLRHAPPPLSASSMEPAHSISAIAQAIGRPKSTVWCERYSRIAQEIEPYADLRCRPARGRVDPRANCRLAEARKRTWSACRRFETIDGCIYRTAQQAEQLWRYLTRRHKRRRPAPIETFTAYDEDRSPCMNGQECRRQNRGRPPCQSHPSS